MRGIMVCRMLMCVLLFWRRWMLGEVMGGVLFVGGKVGDGRGVC